jgi:hypothetical protein
VNDSSLDATSTIFKCSSGRLAGFNCCVSQLQLSRTLLTFARYMLVTMSYIPDFEPEEAEVTIHVESDPEDLQVTLRLHCARPAQHPDTLPTA